MPIRATLALHVTGVIVVNRSSFLAVVAAFPAQQHSPLVISSPFLKISQQTLTNPNSSRSSDWVAQPQMQSPDGTSTYQHTPGTCRPLPTDVGRYQPNAVGPRLHLPRLSLDLAHTLDLFPTSGDFVGAPQKSGSSCFALDLLCLRLLTIDLLCTSSGILAWTLFDLSGITYLITNLLHLKL